LRINTNTQQETGTFSPLSGEVLAETTTYTADWEEYITDGIIRPCGIEMNGTKLLVGDYATGAIHIFETAGGSPVELGQIQTGTDGLAGIKVGPDGKIWYVNYLDNQLVRVEDTVVGINEVAMIGIVLYPNPASGTITLSLTPGNTGNKLLQIYDSRGVLSLSAQFNSARHQVDISGLSNGLYSVVVMDENNECARQELIIQR
jgi:hypothetical protein